MHIETEVTKWEQTFYTKVVGVTRQNPDGSDRQKILAKCKSGQPVKLVREPDNPADKYAIAVYLPSGEMLGYLPSDPRLADHMDKGGGVEAKISEITGGPTFFQKLTRSQGKYYGCNLQITKKDFDWEKVSPFLNKDREIASLIQEAKVLEKDDPKKALALYRQAITSIVELDALGDIARAWRVTPVPINRLSLLLERQGHFEECIQIIEWYEGYSDRRGVPAADAEAIVKRKERVKKKLSKKA